MGRVRVVHGLGGQRHDSLSVRLEFERLARTAVVLRVNEHVRVDVLYGRASGMRKAKIDLFGMIVFLLPATLLMVWMSWPWALDAYVHQEMSSNAGGLIRWPIKILVPLGFALLSLQGFSEIIKRICFLQGSYQMDLQYERPLQ